MIQKMKNDTMRTQINKAKMLKHLKLNLGNVRKSFEAANVKKSTFYDWIKKDAEYRQAVLNVYRGAESLAIESIVGRIDGDIDELIKVQKRNAKKITILAK